MSETASISTATVRRKAVFKDTMQNLLCYMRVLKVYYIVRSVDVRITHIMEQMPFSNALVANSRAKDIRYIRAVKMMITNQAVLPLLEKQGRDAPAVRTSSITKVDDLRRYTSSY